VGDDAPGIHVGQCFARQAAAFLLLIDPGRQCLFHDPATGTFLASRQLIDFLR